MSNHNTSAKLRHGDTGSWFLSSNEFQQWLNDDASPLFWLHAIPGAGKTVLTSSVINYLKHDFQSDEVGLAYFYLRLQRSYEAGTCCCSSNFARST